MTPDETNRHQHTAEEERQIREAALDRTIEASFPASDPPSATQPGGGITGPEVATSDKGGKGSKKPARPS